MQPQLSERFAFDPAHNLLDTTAPSGGRVEGNRVRVYEDKRYDYDAHGNVSEKLIGKHTRMRFEWNPAHQLVKSIVARNSSDTAQTTRYVYDPFGRRIAKRDAFGTTRFLWDGNRLLCEQRGSHCRTYVYGEDAFVPLARIDAVSGSDGAERAEVRYLHTDHLGTPRELTDSDGRVVWAAQYRAWGNVLQVLEEQVPARAPDAPMPAFLEVAQPIRFQGQYYDNETGLHYNRFRYYDPDVGRFVSSDPIGLAGGTNAYRYASNPVSWIDPLGLLPCKSGSGSIESNEQLAATRASVDDKLARYLLNAEHPVGGPKAKWFEKALGFNKANADELASQIVFNEAEAVQTAVIEHGIKYNQVIPITGANGKIIEVTFGWIRNNDRIVRLTTGIPTKK